MVTLIEGLKGAPRPLVLPEMLTASFVRVYMGRGIFTSIHLHIMYVDIRLAVRARTMKADTPLF